MAKTKEIPDLLLGIATRWASKHTKDAAKIFLGRSLVMLGAVHPLFGGLYEVRSSTGGHYLVDSGPVGYPSCSCPDFAYRSARCKHIWAAALSVKLSAELDLLMPPQPKPPKSASVPVPAVPATATLSRDLENRCASLHQRNARLAASITN